MANLLKRLGIRLPIIQAPMAGTSTPQMASAVTNAGGLGSIGVGGTNAAGAAAMIAALREATPGPFNVNVFCHAPAKSDPKREAAWLAGLKPSFNRFGAAPPTELKEIYTSFVADDEMLKLFDAAQPAVVSFHFGLPSREKIDALKAAKINLLASVTSLAEAELAERAGIDGLVAQGYEAGGHRGVFDPAAPDDRLGTLALTRLLVRKTALPVVAAGGIMDGAGIAAVLALGADAAQLGTAFIACPESIADVHFRETLFGPGAAHTEMTTAISGRLARCLPNRMTALGQTLSGIATPDYPITYDAGKALNASAKAKSDGGYGAQWAGQGAPLARALPAADLVKALEAELLAATRTT